MAEWPSTDFLHGHKSSPRRLLRPIEPTLTGSPNHINAEADAEQNREHHSEQDFCRQQFPHEIQLQNKYDPQNPPKSAIQLQLSAWFICEQF
jgi:hypothetical protein